MSDRETVEFLAGVPLLAGWEEADLAECAQTQPVDQNEEPTDLRGCFERQVGGGGPNR